MKNPWEQIFRKRMRDFETSIGHDQDGNAISIKIRVTLGCFHREHSPKAYEIIDRYLSTIPPENINFEYIEHESGPEILVYLALTTAGISLAKSIIDLIIVIIKARSNGIRKGDKTKHPIELIIRRIHKGKEIREETILRIPYSKSFKQQDIERKLKQGIEKLLND